MDTSYKKSSGRIRKKQTLKSRPKRRIVVGPEETPVETAYINHEGIVRGNGGEVNRNDPR
jgi:hypothetical protein